MGCHLTAYRARELHTAAEVFSNRKEVRARLAALHAPPSPSPPVMVRPEPEPMHEPTVDIAALAALVIPAELAPAPPVIPWRPTRRRISDTVAAHFGLTRDEMQGPSRRWLYVRPRQIAMYLCVRHAGFSLPHTGRNFGRDHTTVLHAVKKIEKLCAQSPALADEVKSLADAIEVAP